MSGNNREFSMITLNAVSYLSPNMFWYYEGIGKYLAENWDIALHLTQSQTVDPLADPAMIADSVDVAFICGLALFRLERKTPGRWLAQRAPVMRAERYVDQPIYFSDVIVRAESAAQSFDDLAGSTLCYNDPGSNSGYNTLRARLIADGHTHGFFGRVIQSGSHVRSIALVAAGDADCSAVDSLVLEQELRAKPELAAQLRIIELLGPTPSPPIGVARRLANQSKASFTSCGAASICCRIPPRDAICWNAPGSSATMS